MIQPSDVPAVATAPSARALLLSVSAGALLILLGVASNSHIGRDAASDNHQLLSRRRLAQEWIAGATSEDVVDAHHELEMTIGDAPVASSVSVDDSEVDTIALLGERHSGTNWITNHLQR